ncbi:MAG TPA: hypothetical protein VMV49_12960 [Candidatus Deferrimicrobium sp.]|nr:hypothetical protein [Candidatus Deferrimicrobium sp.]
MNFTFIIPLSAAVVLFSLVVLIFRAFLKTRLSTLLFLAIIPLSFGVWMVDRTISAVSPIYIDLFRISNLCYIIGPMFLLYFVDLISKGFFSWKSIVLTFYGGMLAVGALFVDAYSVSWNPNSGWVQTVWEEPIFYIFLYLYILIIVLIFEGHLFTAYSKNKGDNKQFLKRINIVFLISIVGIFIFNAARSLRLIDYPYLNSIDTLFIALGFGTLSWWYLKRSYLFHLDLLDVQLIGLLVFDNNGPLLYSYEFQSEGIRSNKDLFVGALAGIDSLFKEVLESEQPLKEVRQESKIIILESGKGITIGLVTNLSTIMTRNWVFQFRVAFEKEFKEDLENFFLTGLVGFENKPDPLVKRIFLYQ